MNTQEVPDMSNREIVQELNDLQKRVLAEALQEVHRADAMLQEAKGQYNRLVAMAAPEVPGVRLDLQLGAFYVEHEVTMLGDADVLPFPAADAETDYEGSPDNAHQEGAEAPSD